jgi:phosphatidylserine decarboxylase
MKLTKYGKPLPQILIAAMIGDVLFLVFVASFLYSRVSPTAAVLFGVLFFVGTIPIYIFLITFFRDPERKADREKIAPNLMISPADGTITDISNIDDSRVGGPALRIGIFLSIFSVHVNRAPCTVKVIETIRKDGEFLDARNPESSTRNVSNDLVLEPTDTILNLPNRLVVRQITGLIAKRIVCEAKPGDILDSGQRFGMIKFGSRTELIVPALPVPQIMVKIGQYVHAGQDILLTY